MQRSSSGESRAAASLRRRNLEQCQDFIPREGFSAEQSLGKFCRKVFVFLDHSEGLAVGGFQQPIYFNLRILALRFVIEPFAHAPFMDHFSGEFPRHIEIPGGPIGG